MEISIDTGELRKVGADLQNAAGIVGVRTAAVIRKTAFDIEATGKATIVAMDAVDTGNMLNSVSTGFEGDGRSASMRAEIGPTAEYAHWVHDGTSRVGPRPFMDVAMKRHAPGMVVALEQLLGDLL